jgi:hypothetical protein
MSLYTCCRFFAVSACLLLLSRTAVAAPKTEGAAVSAIIKNVLEHARQQLNSHRAFYKGIEAEAQQRYQQIRESIQTDLNSALAQKDLRSEELVAAIQAKVEILVTGLVLPHAVELHEGVLELVADYKGQACAPGGNPFLCIGGDWDRRRGAMGTIIDSQARDIQVLEELGDTAASKLESLAQELLTLDSDPALLEYGPQHFLANRRVALETLRDGIAGIAPLFDGRTLEGEPVTTYLPCLIGTQIPVPHFKQELQTLQSAVLAYASDHEGWSEYLAGFNEYYDGNSSSPGILSHWSGCIGSKQLQINTLQAALAQARSEGNNVLAASFDSSINLLSQEVLKLQAERTFLQLRREQISAIQASESAQYDSENPSNQAWVTTMIAHADNLIKGMESYPAALRAQRAVMVDALTALDPLVAIQNVPAFKDAAVSAAGRLGTDVERGLNRLKSELVFIGRTVLPNLAQAIRIGESALTSNIGTYEGVLSLQFQAVQNELNSLPGQIAAADQAIAIAQATFDAAAALVADLQNAIQSHDAAVIAITQASQRLESLLGVAQLNPLYSDLSSAFMSALGSIKEYRKFQAQVQSKVGALLKKFDGHGAGEPKLFSCKKKGGKPAAAVCKRKLVKKSLALRNERVAALPADLDALSRAYLDGRSLSELVTDISQSHVLILSRE